MTHQFSGSSPRSASHGQFGGSMRNPYAGSSPRSAATTMTSPGNYDWRGASRSVPSHSPMSLSSSAKVISPITPLGSYLYGDPWLRQRLEWDLQYQPVHHHFLLTALTHTARRLWSVKERLKRTCVREAFLDWREGLLCERLDGRLKRAAQVLKDSLEKHDQQRANSPGRKWSRIRETFARKNQRRRTSPNGFGPDAEGDVLKKRLNAIANARRAVPGGMKLARSLIRLQRQRLMVSIAHWKDLATTPMEAWLAMAHIRENRCTAWRFSSLGATEAELHDTLLPDACRELRKRQVNKDELVAFRGEHLSGARLITGVLKSVMRRWFSSIYFSSRDNTMKSPRPSLQVSPSLMDQSLTREFESSPEQQRTFGSSSLESVAARSSDRNSEVNGHLYDSSKREPQTRSRRSVQTSHADQFKRSSQNSQVADPQDSRVIMIEIGKEGKNKRVSQALHQAAMEMAWQEQQQGLDTRSNRASWKSTGDASASSKKGRRQNDLHRSMSKSSIMMTLLNPRQQIGERSDDSDSDNVFKFSDGSGGQTSDPEHNFGSKLIRGAGRKPSTRSHRSRANTAQSINPTFDVYESGESEKGAPASSSQPDRRVSNRSIDNSESIIKRISVVSQPNANTFPSHDKIATHHARRESDIHPEPVDSHEHRKSTSSHKHEILNVDHTTKSDAERPERSPSLRDESAPTSGISMSHAPSTSAASSKRDSERRTSGITVEPGPALPTAELHKGASSANLATPGKETGSMPPPPSPVETWLSQTKDEPRLSSKSKTSSATKKSENDGEGGEDYDYDEEGEDYDEEGEDNAIEC